MEEEFYRMNFFEIYSKSPSNFFMFKVSDLSQSLKFMASCDLMRDVRETTRRRNRLNDHR